MTEYIDENFEWYDYLVDCMVSGNAENNTRIAIPPYRFGRGSGLTTYLKRLSLYLVGKYSDLDVIIVTSRSESQHIRSDKSYMEEVKNLSIHTDRNISIREISEISKMRGMRQNNKKTIALLDNVNFLHSFERSAALLMYFDFVFAPQKINIGYTGSLNYSLSYAPFIPIVKTIPNYYTP